LRYARISCAAGQTLFLVIIFVTHDFVVELWLVFLQPIQAIRADDQERDRQEERHRTGGRKPLPRACVDYEPTGHCEHCPEQRRREAAEQPGRRAHD